MSDSLKEIPTEMVKILMETGYMALRWGMILKAKTIFEGVQAVRPQSEIPLIGLALFHMHNGKMEEAIRLLKKEALPLNPESEMTRTFLGFLLKKAGFSGESEQVLSEVLKKKDIGREAYAFADEVLKFN